MHIDDNFAKIATALVSATIALVSGVPFIIQKFVQLSTTSQLDMLFIGKEQKKKLELIELFNVIFISTISVYFVPGLFIYAAFSDFIYDYAIILGSIGGIALLITAVTSTNLFKAIKNTKNFEEVKDYVHKQALYVFLSSIFWYYIILTVILNNGIWYEILGLGIVTPILISGIFIYNTNKVQALENKKYSIRILTQDEIITLNLIHNYVIDEKRTLCTLANAPEDKLFYICDFSSEVYLEYTEIGFKQKKLKRPASTSTELEVTETDHDSDSVKNNSDTNVSINIHVNPK
ncbi:MULTISPECIES: hypothetical protein [Bacillus cereus group]|uniref:Uncharacterized protein n=1 Tax=Bacillus mycoides TaxID=1405 RepID=A0A1S9TEZ3_BACMY|nr:MULTISPECIES: hypothetical protein [Bacillus cereus group]MDI6529680.1 hypothetical protein [Bacillus mycoides]MED3396031.1 hypothetical protein [Bacillus wiedmannii]OOR08492.1 hypothetical protein BW900_00725 [Bacillus mycoides]WJE56951.1 hypothetical protein QRE64_18915 [Bacillus mycoides]